MLIPKPSQGTEELNESVAQPRPFVQEHPAGATTGNISEEEQHEFAVLTQPYHIAD